MQQCSAPPSTPSYTTSCLSLEPAASMAFSACESGIIESSVIHHLMAHDAFTRHGLGSSALMILAALSARAHQSVADLVATSSVSRATTYRTLDRLVGHGLVERAGTLWALAPGALQGAGVGNSHREAVTDPAEPAPTVSGWDAIAAWYGTAGTAVRRRALHCAERAAYLAALEEYASHRRKATVVIRDGRAVLVPARRGDEVPDAGQGPGGSALDPLTGVPVPGWRVATDGRLTLVTAADERSYDELAQAHAEAVHAWESAA